MRKTFEPQLTLGCTPIEEVEFPVKTTSHLAALIEALKYIFVSPEWNQRIFSLLSEKLTEGKKPTGRKGMSLWEVFVLGQIRLCMNISYDELYFWANRLAMGRVSWLSVWPSAICQSTIRWY